MNSSPRVVVRTEPLAEGFSPPGMPFREEHLRGLLESLTAGARPLAAWLHGPPGTGKTLTATRAPAALEERGVRTAYVNCWEASTVFAVLEERAEAALAPQAWCRADLQRIAWAMWTPKPGCVKARREPGVHDRGQS